MPKSVLLPLSFILWERLKEREMKRKTLFSISVISFKLESSNILLKIGELVNGGKSPDSHVLYSVVPLSCFVTFGSYFKPPFLHLHDCKNGRTITEYLQRSSCKLQDQSWNDLYMSSY